KPRKSQFEKSIPAKSAYLKSRDRFQPRRSTWATKFGSCNERSACALSQKSGDNASASNSLLFNLNLRVRQLHDSGILAAHFAKRLGNQYLEQLFLAPTHECLPEISLD